MKQTQRMHLTEASTGADPGPTPPQPKKERKKK